MHGDRIRSIAAHKRPSEADASKWVVDYILPDRLAASHGIRWQPLPVALDLGALYASMLRTLIPTAARPGESLKAQVDRLAELRQKQREADKLEIAIRREKQFNRKVELNTQLRQIRDAIAGLTGPEV